MLFSRPMSISTLILAAGKGTRMKSDKSKVMHEILGYPLVWYPVSIGFSLGTGVIGVIGHGKEQVGPYLSSMGIKTAVQNPPLGTGHAVLVARELLEKTQTDDILIIPGDMPLIRKESIERLIGIYKSSGAQMGILTSKLPNPFGYGRIVRDHLGYVTAIVEEIDATPDIKALDEVNTSVYIAGRKFLIEAVGRIKNDNAKGEYYLTDIVRMADGVVGTETMEADEANGINSRDQLAYAASVMQERINLRHMTEGVSIVAPICTWISPEVTIGRDSEIWPGVHIMGKSSVGENTVIMPGAWVKDSAVGINCTIGQCAVIEGTAIPKASIIEPFRRV
jgi:bifunctional UDP-N-acetylglucosamine pyrophosphorylase / glucosamine-1-phosphate N-acetyltransferase